ncbi:MAG: hypothetical protein ACQEXX_32095 [Bacillota bacterium]
MYYLEETYFATLQFLHELPNRVLRASVFENRQYQFNPEPAAVRIEIMLPARVPTRMSAVLVQPILYFTLD